MTDDKRPSREVVEKLLAASGKTVTLTTAGEVLLDVDGIPSAVGPSKHTTGRLIVSPEGLGWPDWPHDGGGDQ